MKTISGMQLTLMLIFFFMILAMFFVIAYDKSNDIKRRR